MPELSPIEAEVIRLCSEIPTTWQKVDIDALPSTTEEAFRLLVRSGLAEGRARVLFSARDQVETFTATACASGIIDTRRLFSGVWNMLPVAWKSPDNTKLANVTTAHWLDFHERRLTSQGEIAKRDIWAGESTKVLWFVFHDVKLMPAPVELTIEGFVSSAAAAKPKRAAGGAQELLKAALSKHHKFDNGGVGNLVPVGVRELERLAGGADGPVGRKASTAFFKKWFKNYVNYQSVCKRQGELVLRLKILRGETASLVSTLDERQAIADE